MKIKFITIAILLLPFMAKLANAQTNSLSLIPIPQKVEAASGVFKLTPESRILAPEAFRDTGDYLAARFRTSTGYRIKVLNGEKTKPITGDIVLNPKMLPHNEGYELLVNHDTVAIEAGTSDGIFYGVQTLLQLFPPEIFAIRTTHSAEWTIPGVRIYDSPRFAWRGWMLDVARHFFDKEEIERQLDLMAMHKLNVFHWHLADDQGWRIEIKKYPKLTEAGAWRKSIGFDLDNEESTAYGPDGRYGGFYTQADIREVIAYAQTRHITIVPEIEMPGHSITALMAYPELSCTGGPFDTDVNAGIFDGVFCAGNEKTFTFLEDVLTEVMELFPGKYIHIGGDEAPKTNWEKCPKCQARMKQENLTNENELQSYFVRRMEKFINAHGRSLVGWSEISEGGLAKNATVMDWKGGAVEAARSGHDVVMASQAYGYLCYYPSLDRVPYLRAYRPWLPLSKVYGFEPVPAELEPQYQSHIIGTEACLWTVYFGLPKELDEMNYPRLSAWAESAWSPKAAKNWDDFQRRLPAHLRRLGEAGVSYWHDSATKLGEWQPAQIKTEGGALEWKMPASILVPGKCRVSLDYVRGKNPVKIQWAALLEDGHEILRDTHPGFTGNSQTKEAKAHDWNYFFDVTDVKPGATYSVRAFLMGDAGTDSYGVVFLDPKPVN